jgi:hypothetical protein
MVDTAACEPKTRSRETPAMVDTACAAMTRSHETRATGEQWLALTLNLGTQVPRYVRTPDLRLVGAAAFIAVAMALPPMEAWYLTRFAGT